MRRTPIDRGFGVVAMLAGVRKGTLKLLEGASYSSEPKKPLTIEIAIAKSSSAGGGTHPRNEYILRNKIEEKTRWRFTGSSCGFSLPTRTSFMTDSIFRQMQARHCDSQVLEYEMIEKSKGLEVSGLNVE